MTGVGVAEVVGATFSEGFLLFNILLQLEYSRELNQLVSGCADCSLRVWDAETGNHLLSVGPDSHGPGVKLTAARLDRTGYRLATGAEDGSVKVWDVGSGHELKERKYPGHGKDGIHGEDCTGVIGVSFCEVESKRCIVVVGRWNHAVLLSVIIFLLQILRSAVFSRLRKR